MRVLITGATGFVGRPLVQRLIEHGAEPVGLALPEDLDQPSASAEGPAELRLIAADLRNAAATADIVAQVKPDRIIHLAAVGVTDPGIESHLALEHNVHGALNLIHAAFQNRALPDPPGQMIVIRTPGERHPSNAYAASKAAAWSFCQMYAARYQWPILGAMIFQAYGPHQAAHTFVQAALRQAKGGKDFAMTSGKQRRDWIYIDDVVSGLVAATAIDLPPGASVDLGTGISTSLLDVANLAYELTGRGGKPMPGAVPDRAGEEVDQFADVLRSKGLLNWMPKIELAKGLQMVFSSLSS